jgi:dUTPase
MMEFAVAMMLGSTAIIVGSVFLYLALERAGFVRPGLKNPVLKIMQLKQAAPAYESVGTSVTFMAPYPIVIDVAERVVVESGYYVEIPDGYCGVLAVRTDGYRDRNQRLHDTIGTGHQFLTPGFQGEITVEIWNKHFEEPAGLAEGLPFAELHLVPIPDALRIADSL